MDKNEKFFWEMWKMSGKSTLQLFNSMIESKKFEERSLKSWKKSTTGNHLVQLYKRYKEYVVTNEIKPETDCLDRLKEENKDFSKEVNDFVKELKEEIPDVEEWLDSLGDDE